MRKVWCVGMLMLAVLLTRPVFGGSASGREPSIAAVNRCLAALHAKNAAGALMEFAAAEHSSTELSKELDKFGASAVIASGAVVNPGVTGNSDVVFQGQNIAYLFGDLSGSGGKPHFTADLVREDSGWKLVRLFVDGAGNVGSDRISYEKVPKVNNAVESMVAAENVLDQFMRAGQRNDLVAALGCWVRSERERAGKKDEIAQLIRERTGYFVNFQHVEEGRTNFGFDGPKDAVRIVKADGTMTYPNGATRPFVAELEREDGILKIRKLRLSK